MNVEEMAKKAMRKKRLPAEEHLILLRLSYVTGTFKKKEFLKLKERIERGEMGRDEFERRVLEPLSTNLKEILLGFYNGLLADLPEGFSKKGRKEADLSEQIEGKFVRCSKGLKRLENLINAFPSTQRIFYREALERLRDVIENPTWLKSIEDSMLSQVKIRFTSYARALKKGNITLSLAHSKGLMEIIRYSKLIVEINSNVEEVLTHVENILVVKRRRKEIKSLHKLLLRSGVDVRSYIHRRHRLTKELGKELLHNEREYLENRVSGLEELEETVDTITPILSAPVNLSRRDRVLKHLSDVRNTIPHDDYPSYVLLTFQPFTSMDKIEDAKRIQMLRWDLGDLMTAGGVTEDTLRSYLRSMAVILEGNLKGTARAESLYDTVEVMKSQGLQNTWQRLRMRLDALRKATEAVKEAGIEPSEEQLQKMGELEELLRGEPNFAIVESVTEELKGVEKELEGIMKGREDQLILERAENLMASLKALRAEGLDVTPLLERVQETLVKEKIVYPMQELIDLYDIEREIRKLEEELKENKLKSMKAEIEERLKEAEERGLEVALEKESLAKIESNWDKWSKERLTNELQALNYSIMNRLVGTRKEELKEQLQLLRKEATESSAALDLSEAMSLLNEAEKMFESNQLEFADAYLRRAQEALDMNRKVFITESSFSKLNNLKEEVEALKESGADVFEVEQLLTEAEDLLIKERYEEAKATLDQVDRRFSTLREEYLNYFIPQQIEQIRETSENLSRKGIPSRFITTRLEELEDALRAGDLKGSLRLLNEAKRSLERIYLTDNVTALPERIMRLRETKERLKGYGVAIEDVEALLDEAERLLSAEDFSAARELTDRAENILKEREINFQKSSYKTMFERSQELIDMMRKEGIEVKVPELEINLAQDSYSRGDYSKAFNLMKSVVDYLEREYKEKYFSRKKQVYFDQIEELKGIYNELPENKKKEFEEALRAVEERLLLDDLEGADSMLERMREIVLKGEEQIRVESLRKSIRTMDVLIKRLKDAGVDVGEAPKLLKEIEEEIDRGNIEKAEELTERLETYLVEEKRGVLEENLRVEIEGLRRRIRDLRNVGMDMEYAANIVSKAEELIEVGKVDEASRLLGEANEIVEAAEEVAREGRLFESAKEVEQLIEELKGEGVEVPETELLEKARELAASGELEEAEEMLRRLKETLSARRKEILESRFTEEVGEILKEAVILKEEGLEIENIEAKIKEATEKFQNEDYERAFQILKDLRTIVDELKGAREIGDVKKALERVLASLEYYYGRRERLPRKLRELEKAVKSALESGDEEEMSSVLEEVLSLQMSDKLARAVSRNIRRYSGELISEIKPDEETMEVVSERISRLTELIKRGDYNEAVKEGFTLLGMLVEMKKKKELEKEMKRIEVLRREVELLKNEGYSVEVIENILTEAEMEFQEGDYDRARVLLKRGKDYLKELSLRYKLERAREAIDLTEALVRYLKDNFVGISSHLRKPEELLKKAREAFINRKYRTAEKYANRARELIEGNEELNLEQFLYVFYSLHLNERISDYISKLEAMSKKVRGAEGIIEELKVLRRELESGMDPTVGEMRLKEIRTRMRALEETAQKNEAFEALNNLYKKLQPYMDRREKSFREAVKYYNLAKEAFSFQEYSKVILYSKRALFMLKRALTKERKG